LGTTSGNICEEEEMCAVTPFDNASIGKAVGAPEVAEHIELGDWEHIVRKIEKVEIVNGIVMVYLDLCVIILF
jgi:hypothetical protein